MPQNKYIPRVSFHPGETLAEKLTEMEMSIKEFSVRTSKPEKTIYAIINDSSSITSDMAVAFESVTNIPAQFWLNKQRTYDEYVARNRRLQIIAASREWASKFPFEKMAEYGWVKPCDSIEEKVNELFLFFRISTVEAWEDYYYHQQLKVVFRISLYNTKKPYSISAWLRRGELQAAELSVPEFSEKGLKSSIQAMRELMKRHPNDYVDKLQKLCCEVGVKLVYTPCLPKTPISGSTRWINDTPLIQLSDCNKKYGTFWFTFFHEIGHILLHGKKDIFLEDIDYPDKTAEKEEAADNFAKNILSDTTAENA
jgi:HTH-type transcriptional regulator/antitoxin HigA